MTQPNKIKRSRLIDLTGHVFGSLTVQERVDKGNGNTRWRCSCSCGKEVTRLAIQLRNGVARHCGSPVHKDDPLPAPDLKTLRARVKEARLARGLTYRDVAQLVDLSPSFVCEIEYGKKQDISANTLLKLAKALNVSCDWLLTGCEKEPLPCPVCNGTGKIVF